LLFVSLIPQALLNSTPQLLACDRRAVAQLGPGDFGDGGDVFSANDFSERDDAIGYQFRVLGEVGWLMTLGMRIFPGGVPRRTNYGLPI
jgi:hypothetical protein